MTAPSIASQDVRLAPCSAAPEPETAVPARDGKLCSCGAIQRIGIGQHEPAAGVEQHRVTFDSLGESSGSPAAMAATSSRSCMHLTVVGRHITSVGTP